MIYLSPKNKSKEGVQSDMREGLLLYRLIYIMLRPLPSFFLSQRPLNQFAVMQLLEVSFENTPLVTEREINDIFQGKTVRKLNVPDLPLEIWLEILSYLPRGFVWRMIGINRLLFELGMNEIYKEVYLMKHEGVGLQTLEQIG